MQLARYNKMHQKVLKYQKTIPENLANKSNLLRHKVDIWFFLLAYFYCSPAAWAKDLSSEACFRSIASFRDPHYLSRTSPHSIQCAWNSRIWNFEFRKTLLPQRNLWNFAPCKRFRPVHCNTLQHTATHCNASHHYEYVCVCVCVCVCASVCLFVRGYSFKWVVNACFCMYVSERVYICEKEREREREIECGS